MTEHSPASPDPEKGKDCVGLVRVLCLGNDLLADDALGVAVAERIRELFPGQIDVVETPESGFNLMDHLLGSPRLVVIDTVMTGRAEPGTIYVLRENEMRAVPGVSPHYIGLFETLAVGRQLRLPVPEDVVIVAVEAADCFTVGGAMHPAVQAALSEVAGLVRELWRAPTPNKTVGGLRGC